MSLLALQKQERRARILAEARRQIAAGGWNSLTMRDLARASRVSVPTVYNLVGGKEALLSALMEDLFTEVSETGLSVRGSWVERAQSLWRAGLEAFTDAPGYARELVRLFASMPGPNAIRRDQQTRYVPLMAAILHDGQRQGDLARLIAPEPLARTMYSHWIAQTLRWAHGELSDDALRVAVERGLSLLLLGLARDESREALTRSLAELADAPSADHAKSSEVTS